MNDGNTPARGIRTRLMRFLWWLVRVDPELLAGCPTIDRFQMLSKAVLLCAVAGIAMFAWGGFFFLFWPWYVAVPLTAVAIVWIVLLDQFMGAARWALQGVLAAPGKARMLSAAIVVRIAVGLVTASATALSATLALNHATIDEQLQEIRDTKNAAKRTAGEAEKARLRQTMLGAADAEVKQATAELEAVNARLEAARHLRDSASEQVTESKIKANCQLNGGPGCRKGIGPQYQEALLREDKAAGDLRRAGADIPQLEAAVAAGEHKRDEAVAAVRAGEPAFLEAAKPIDARVAAELVPPRNDPTMSYMALQAVFASPAGPAARFYSHIMLMLLLTVEMSYVLVSEYFGHASVYMARLIARTKILAAEAADEYRRKTRALFGRDDDDDDDVPPSRSRGFRVVPRFGTDDRE
jgi:hypothetical protein